MTLREYIDTIRNKKVAVIGIGVSNTPLLRLLLRLQLLLLLPLRLSQRYG